MKITLNSTYCLPLVPMHCVPLTIHVYQTFWRKLLLYKAMKIENMQPILLRRERKWFYKVVDRCITSSPSVLGQKGQHNTQWELDSWKGKKFRKCDDCVDKNLFVKSCYGRAEPVFYTAKWWTVHHQARAGQTIRWRSIKIQFNFTFPIFVLAH